MHLAAMPRALPKPGTRVPVAPPRRSVIRRARGCVPAKAPSRAGYTLVELLVVMALLGILSSLVFPLAQMSVQREREQQLRRALWELRDGIDAYKRTIDRGGVTDMPGGSGYPSDLQSLVKGVPTAKPGGRVVFLRRIPRDPFADPSLPPEQTWGLRSYLSSADDPRPGVDVYDVYSKSTLVGLNGVPLRQW